MASKQRRLADPVTRETADMEAALDERRYRFCEFFAGQGPLTSAASAAGVPTRPPDDLALGGVDFESKEAVEGVRRELGELAASGVKLVVHFAPPCSTFSRARGRSARTKLRSDEFPQGLPRCSNETRTANLIARNTLDLVEWLARDVGAAVSVENPKTSFLWAYLDFAEDVPYSDILFSACMFGAPYQKHTRLRCWNWLPPSLEGHQCSLTASGFSCGRTSTEGHEVLEFGGRSTADAAAYVPGLCSAWARDIRAFFEETPDYFAAQQAIDVASSGRVRRHQFRGATDESAKEKQRQEDLECAAGCRNPASFVPACPQLSVTMDLVRSVLLRAWKISSDLRGLVGCCGESPTRQPPLEASLLAVRGELERVFGVPAGTFDWHHEASPWRAELVGTILHRSGDSDAPLWNWLQQGAPMGLSRPITPGGLFPRVVEEAWSTLDQLDGRTPWDSNHPSFNEVHGDDAEARSPAWDLLEEQVNHGFALLFPDAEAASVYLGGKCHPAPLGNVVKTKDDGSLKHRLIQDLRANGVNNAVQLTERQVLPRGIDHGIDLAALAKSKTESEELFTLVLDFKDAFMSIPLHRDEQRFNCANAGFVVKRSRPSLFEGEPIEGTFVVWRTLGFGGRPNPLVFSRAASFAARTAQGLLQSSLEAPQDPSSSGPAPGRVQLYVDDPVVTVKGIEAKAHETLDLVILWWMTLGLPLSWKKGSLARGGVVHRWIGIDFSLSEGGAIMRLPPRYVEELLQLIEPLCLAHGSITLAELDVVIGKAGRVAYVVPAAKPFVAGLWGGLAGILRDAAASGFSGPSRKVSCRRLCYAASWVRALLAEDESCPLPLERLVGAASPPSSSSTGSWTIEFDASVYGGGAVLRDTAKRVVEYFSVIWTNEDAQHLYVVTHDPKHQSFWEFATLLLALMTWGDNFVQEPVLIAGDNTAALSGALSLKGKGELLAVARELSWRQARRGWKFSVGHLPSEFNVVADALSRTTDPKGVDWPSVALAEATFAAPPKLREVWLACPW